METGKVVTASALFVITLIIGLIVGFTIITNIGDVGDSLATGTSTKTVSGETGAYANVTTYTVAAASYTGFNNGVVLTSALNTTSGLNVVLANLTMSTAGVLSNATAVVWDALTITYTYNLKDTVASTAQLRSNFTTGVNNVSNKLPTIFLIGAVVIVLAILMILWGYYKRMGLGSSGGNL